MSCRQRALTGKSNACAAVWENQRSGDIQQEQQYQQSVKSAAESRGAFKPQHFQETGKQADPEYSCNTEA